MPERVPPGEGTMGVTMRKPDYTCVEEAWLEAQAKADRYREALHDLRDAGEAMWVRWSAIPNAMTNAELLILVRLCEALDAANTALDPERD